MSIAAVNVSYVGAAPVAGGSGILAFGGSSNQEFSYLGTVTITHDNSTVIGVINWLDGTNALPFTPTGVIATRVGGNAANSVAVTMAKPLNNVAGEIHFSAAGANGLTTTIAILVLK